MAQAREVVPVMEEKVAPRSRASRTGSKAAASPRKGLGGPYGASFTGEGTRGLTFERRWTRPGVHPYDEIAWEYRTAGISSESGKTVFEQKDVEVPVSWSQLATNVVVSKYFRGHVGTPEREHSVRQLIDRVVNTIAAWAETNRYFATDEDLAAFQAELTHLLVHQKMALQLAGLVQRRDRAEAAVLCVLHQLRPGRHEQHHGPRQDRGHAVQVRLRRGSEPVPHPLVQGQDVGRRHRVGPRQLHARLRRVRGRDQVRRQDPPRRQDGHPRRRPSGHRRVHRQQGARGEEGLGPHRAGYDPSFTGEAYGASSSRTPTTASA